MVLPVLIGSGILAGAGVVLIGIATALTGIIGSKKEGDTKNKLLASAGISGFSALLALIAAIVGLAYGVYSFRSSTLPLASFKKETQGWLIAFIVLTIIVIVMYIVVIALNVTLRKNPELDPSQQNSMTTGIVLAGIGLLCIIIASIIIYAYGRSKAPKGTKEVAQVGQAVEQIGLAEAL